MGNAREKAFASKTADRRAAAPVRAPCGGAHPALALQGAVGNRGALALVQRKCAACSSGSSSCPTCGDEALVQRSADGSPVGAPRSNPLAGQGGGEPLGRGVRGFMENRFGRDFSGVRVHTDAAAATAAGTLNAVAFTHGRDIYFGAGTYRPDTPAGRHLLAHELTHTIQQKDDAPPGGATIQGFHLDGGAGDPLEHEADRAADAAVSGRGAPLITTAPARSGRTGIVQRQDESPPQPTRGVGICNAVGIELPNRIYFSGDQGTVSATVTTTIPTGDYWITYSPADGRFSVGAIGYNPTEPPTLTVGGANNPALFDTYRESVTRQGVRLHVAGSPAGTEGGGRPASVPDASISAGYAAALADAQLDGHADVYRTRLDNLPTGPERDAVAENLRVIQSELLKRQASNLQVVGQSPRPPGLPPEGCVLQPATDLPAEVLNGIPEGQVVALPSGPVSGGTGGPDGAAVPEGGAVVVTIEPLDANMNPVGAGAQAGASGVRPTDVTTPLAAGGAAMNAGINAGLRSTGFASAGADAIGLVGVPRWFTTGARVPETLSVWGHTAVYVRRAGQIVMVRGFSPQMGGTQLLQLMQNFRAVEQGTSSVPAAIGADASLFTLTGARSIEYPVPVEVAESLLGRLPAPGPVQPGGNVPPLYTARPAVYRACSASNCVLWAAQEAEQALGGVIGPANRGVSVTALGEGATIVEGTASQGRFIQFTRAVAAGEEAAAPALATGAPVAGGMSRGLQVLKWGGRAFFVIGLATIPLEVALAAPEKRARTAVGASAGFIGGFAAGAAAGLVCGPGAPACSLVLGLTFGIAGGLVSRAAAEHLYDAVVALADTPGSIVAPPTATTLVFRGGFGGLLRSPADLANEMRQQRSAR